MFTVSEIILLAIEVAAEIYMVISLFSSFNWLVLVLVLVLPLLIIKNIQILRILWAKSKMSHKNKTSQVLGQGQKSTLKAGSKEQPSVSSSSDISLIDSCKRRTRAGIKHPFFRALKLKEEQVDSLFDELVLSSPLFYSLKKKISEPFPWKGEDVDVRYANRQLTIRDEVFSYRETTDTIEIGYHRYHHIDRLGYYQRSSETIEFLRFQRSEDVTDSTTTVPDYINRLFVQDFQTESLTDPFGAKGSFQVARFSYLGLETFTSELGKSIPEKPILEIPGDSHCRIYFCDDENGRFWKTSSRKAWSVYASSSSFTDAVKLIREADLSKEEKDSCVRKLREYYPVKEFRLSDFCDRKIWFDWQKHNELKERLEQTSLETRLLEMAKTFFGSVQSPLMDPSGDPEGDRLEAMLRIYRFVQTLDLHLAHSFLNADIDSNGMLEYLYFECSGTCYDGGCYSDESSEDYIRMAFHPEEEWEERLFYGAVSWKAEFPFGERTLSQGDCACFIEPDDGYLGGSHLNLLDPFGLRGVLEFWVEK